MFELTSKHGKAFVFARTVEDEALNQIINMLNSPLGENADFRAMPDCHSGAGCTVGTTMRVTDKVCPNLVGSDIGCGVLLWKTDISWVDKLPELDAAIRKLIPYGPNTHKKPVIKPEYFEELLCADKLSAHTLACAIRSLGTLGGGNHFIEAYSDGGIAVHTGSRNIGYKVADFYQYTAEKKLKSYRKSGMADGQRDMEYIRTPNELAYLTGGDAQSYMHDLHLMQEFAQLNREKILREIVSFFGGNVIEEISSVHNYIGDDMILRKGAIAAYSGQRLIIPLNMRDGVLLCTGKGNPDWNYSAPHGAGRLMSRADARSSITLDAYKESMEGIFTTCANESTIDESPFAYKNREEIIECIEPTVEINERLSPIYNFKASDG